MSKVNTVSMLNAEFQGAQRKAAGGYTHNSTQGTVTVGKVAVHPPPYALSRLPLYGADGHSNLRRQRLERKGTRHQPFAVRMT